MAHAVKAQVPSHAAPRNTEKADKANKVKKEKKPEVTVIPAWKDVRTGGIALEDVKRKDGSVKRVQPKQFGKDDFPRTSDGRKAYCDMQIARWEWLKANWATKAGKDPAAKAERELANIQKKLVAALVLTQGLTEADATAKVAQLLAKK